MTSRSDPRVEELYERLARHGAVSWFDSLLDERGIRLAVFLNYRGNREPEVVALRHEVWSVLHGSLGLGMAQLGRIFGCDHTTVISGIRRRGETIMQVWGYGEDDRAA